MTEASSPWLEVTRGEAPLLVSLPHTGTDLAGLEPRLASRWLGQRDADWHIEKLYDFAAGLGATVVRTPVSRTVIDVNRDPSGASLYPGQATTSLCPLETFDGEPLYRSGEEPVAAEIEARLRTWFDPYHAALGGEIERLRRLHRRIVLYDCHSIRSVIPRLFEGTLPGKVVTHLWDKHRIIVTPIDHPEFKCVRVTPNVYTTIAETDKFGDVMEELIRKGVPA